jgi:hypothetical protein
MAYLFAPKAHQLDGVLRPMNPLMGIDETPTPIFSPLIRSDIGTPTYDILTGNQFQMPALNGGLGAVADALSVLSVVDLLTRP